MARAIINYKKNDIRLTTLNFLTAAFLYMYLVGELIGGRSLFLYHDSTVFIVLFAGEIAVCAGSIIAALYQQRYNRRLAETGLGINRWFLSERTFNRLAAAATLLIGWYLFNTKTFVKMRVHSPAGMNVEAIKLDNYYSPFAIR